MSPEPPPENLHDLRPKRDRLGHLLGDRGGGIG